MRFCFIVAVVLVYFVATVYSEDFDMKSIYKNIAKTGEFDVSKLDSLVLTEAQIDYAIEKAIEDVSIKDLDFLTSHLMYATSQPSSSGDATQLKVTLKFKGFSKSYNDLSVDSNSESKQKLDKYSVEGMTAITDSSTLNSIMQYFDVTKMTFKEGDDDFYSSLRKALLGDGDEYSLITTTKATYPDSFLASIGLSASDIAGVTEANLQESIVSGSFNENLANSGSNQLAEATFVGFTVKCVQNCGGDEGSSNSSDGLSGGAIAGIVIGSLALSGGVGAGIYYGMQSKRNADSAYVHSNLL